MHAPGSSTLPYTWLENQRVDSTAFFIDNNNYWKHSFGPFWLWSVSVCGIRGFSKSQPTEIMARQEMAVMERVPAELVYVTRHGISTSHSRFRFILFLPRLSFYVCATLDAPYVSQLGDCRLTIGDLYGALLGWVVFMVASFHDPLCRHGSRPPPLQPPPQPDNRAWVRQRSFFI